MNAIIRLYLLILMGICSLDMFGECPIKKYTDVVTACVGENDFGIVYHAGIAPGEVDAFPLRPNKRTGKGYTHGIGCVDETPSPAWFTMKIEESGDLLMKISHSDGEDIDFVCWGPFQGETKQKMLQNVCAYADVYFEDYEVTNTTNTCLLSKYDQCEAKYAGEDKSKKLTWDKISSCKGQADRLASRDIEYECFYGKYDPYPMGKMIDCSFSNDSFETCYIEKAKAGDWYLFLITNFSEVAGTIDFTKIAGGATTDCSVIVDAGSNSSVCEGETLELFVNNLPAYATCRWTGPNGYFSEENSPKIPGVNKSYEGTYYVQVTTHDGLMSDEIPVEVNVLKNAPVDTTIRIVEGDVINFKGTELSKAGTFEVLAKSGTCMKTFNVTVVVEPLLPAYIVHNGPVCEGDSLILTIEDAPTSGVEGYVWSGPNKFYSTLENPVVSKMNKNKAGSYSLKIKKDGLTYPVAPVKVDMAPKVVEKMCVHVPFGESYEFAGSTLNQRGVYYDTLQSSYGCDSIVELSLIIDMPILEPNEIVSPNGDGENDVWEIKNIWFYPEAVVRVFDRYGKCLYEATEYGSENVWEGFDADGRKLPSTDYWYTIDVQTADKVYVGHFTLIR